ncbi:MAG: GNAT family N-acetyltransferase [Halanaerobiales bacterium]|nr:GNAT family N-acetyltransferase [Halanaerobiales bacterium]
MSTSQIKYRTLSIEESNRISEIDPSQWIEKVWRKIDGKYQLVKIDFMEEDWPDGFEAYRDAFKNTINSGGIAFGAFNKEGACVGYVTLNNDFFGKTAKYLLLDSLFVSRPYRGIGIGKSLVNYCTTCAKTWGAEKLYTCAGSAEDTIAFYKSIGWVEATEINTALFEEDERDIQLEYDLIKVK